MMHIPDSFKPLIPTAERCKATDLEFSGGTYQVQIADPDTQQEEWAFIQLDPRGRLKDCFCSCENGDHEEPCAHIVAAFLRIYIDKTAPLHQRFERSLWNVLASLYAKSVGDDVHVLRELGPGDYEHRTSGGRVAFEVKGLNKKAIDKIEELLHQRKKETEETSLKFSNLSPEELVLWREGRPSQQLKYELSFWNDFAKWLMVLQDDGVPYRISFEYDNDGLPDFLLADFKDVSIGFFLSRTNLPLIVPALSTVKSPLKVYGGTQKAFKKIAYDRKSGILLIDPLAQNAVDALLDKKGILIPGWRFVSGMGFYPSDQKRLIEQRSFKGEEISLFLTEHLPLIKNNLEGASLHTDPVRASYTLVFDKDWNLHITAYLLHPGDLTTGDSRYFGEWAYLDNDGFYRVQGMRFQDVKTIIPAEQVGALVSQYRAWFNSQDGFQTHVVGVESQLSYEVSPSNQLTFQRVIKDDSSSDMAKDFSPWIYVPGQGFYAKTSIHTGLPIKPGISLHQDQIPLFIRANTDELKLVPGFFNPQSPIIRSSLSIGLDSDNTITVTPVDDVDQEYDIKKLRFFDDFVYAEGHGFSELPVSSRLPFKYRQIVHVDPKEEEAFIVYELKALEPFISHIDERLTAPTHGKMDLVGLEQKDHAYELKLKYATEFGSVPITTLWKGIKTKQRFVFSEAGMIDLEDKRWHWLQWLNKKQVDQRAQTIKLTNWELMRLDAFESFAPTGSKKDDIQKTLDDLFNAKSTTKPDLEGLNSQLRPYQEIGINWLWFLYQQGLSGLLCDDMGLGKTHQTMALLAAVHNASKGKTKHYLVVCPTSVLYHWQEKLAQFLPHFRVFTFYGSKRSLEGFQQEYDILLTSYGVWRQDVEILTEIPFEVAIFDEIQIAKNHNSRIYATLQAVQAKMRLGLTGTPVENHLRELKALFDLMLDGYMPGDVEYRELFVKPIERDNDIRQKRLLSRLIKPFVLRRKKGDVLLDLPEKIEEVAHCDLAPEQQKLYDDVLMQSRERILRELEDGNTPIPYIHIFALLSSLKQICDHPAVYMKKPEDFRDYESGKWDLFLELLEEARESQQKVVVFSQYLYMLDIIEDYLKEKGIGYATIRGATQNRGEQLKRFKEDPTCEVFVASLQASGLGVDLTTASVVIHYDRWWNAARENQATDRVHRIGQTRGVQVFKLVTKNTFEERIDELIARKGRLMEEVVGVDEQDVIKQFTRDEIIQLLKLVN